MSPNPAAFLDHLREAGYHPRSDKHSNALAEAIAADLFEHCPQIRKRAAQGKLVYDLNFELKARTADWNVDLVLGEPGLGAGRADDASRIPRQTPSTVQIAIAIKSVMTEHRKAIKNRKRDLEAHHEHVHNYKDKAIAGGVLVINAAPVFKSPLRGQPTVHREPDTLLKHCVSELESVAVRGGRTPYGLEACCAIVVSFDNINRAGARFVTSAAAPSLGEPLHYDSFIRTLCEVYTRRF